MPHPTPPQSLAIVGLGYVGLPLAIQFAKAGLKVTGIDVDAAKVVKLNEGESYIGHIASEAVAGLKESGRFQATTDFAAVAECEAVILCVPTLLNQNREPDLSYVLDTGRSLAPHLKEWHSDFVGINHLSRHHRL